MTRGATFRKKFPSPGFRFRCVGRFWRQSNSSMGRIIKVLWLVIGSDLDWILNERFDVVNQSPPCLFRQMSPGWHSRARHPARYGREQVLVRGCAIPSRDQTKPAINEITGLRIQKVGGWTLPISSQTMTRCTLLQKSLLAQFQKACIGLHNGLRPKVADGLSFLRRPPAACD